MIKADQPTCFPSDVLVAVSSRSDGTVLDRSIGIHAPEIVANRRTFSQLVGVNYDDVAYQRIVYDDLGTYSLIADVDNRSTNKFTVEVVADALFTRSKGVGMMLPVADCVATVVHDPIGQSLALAHLGRHSTLTDIVDKLISHFELHGSKTSDLIVWMSPSAHKQSYRMDYFNHIDDPLWHDFAEKRNDGIHLDIAGFNRQRFIDAGLKPDNVYVSSIDTFSSPDYFSHSNGDTKDRFAVLAMMR